MTHPESKPMENELTKRLLSEAPQAWQDYLRFARTLQVETNAANYPSPEQRYSAPRRSRTEIRQASAAALYMLEHVDPTGEDQVEAANPRYAFALKRADPSKGWILAGLEWHTNLRVSKSARRPCNRGFCGSPVPV
jgi:hypothetical protein